MLCYASAIQVLFKCYASAMQLHTKAMQVLCATNTLNAQKSTKNLKVGKNEKKPSLEA